MWLAMSFILLNWKGHTVQLIIYFLFTCLSSSSLELHWKVHSVEPLESKAQCSCLLFFLCMSIFSHLSSSARKISSSFSCPALSWPSSWAVISANLCPSPDRTARLAGCPAWSCPPPGGSFSSAGEVLWSC